MRATKTILPDCNYYRLLRLNLRLQIKEVVKATGIARSTLWRFENGKEILFDNLVKLNDYYNSIIEIHNKLNGNKEV